MACPGSVNLTAGMSEGSSSPAAQEGTNAHFLLEYCLNNALLPMTFIGQDMTEPDSKVEFTVTHDMAAAVDVAFQYVQAKFKDYADRGEFIRFYPETKVLPSRFNRLDCEGTADIIIETTDEIEVVDYKHGKGVVVEATDNPQLMIYGIGALDTMGLDLSDQRHLKTTIIQPRADHFIGPVRSAIYQQADVDAFTQKAITAAAACDAGVEFHAGESQCRWCLAKATCKTLAEHSLQSAQAVFTDLSTTDSATIEGNMLRSPDELTIDQTLMVLDNETLIRGFLDAVHKRAVDTLNAGDDIPGYKLVAGRKSRKWKLKDDKLDKLLRGIKKIGGGKVTKEDILTMNIKSPAQIEKLLKPQLTEKAFDKIKGAINTSEGAPQLAPSSSSKPALPKATDVFDNVEVPDFLK